MGEPRTAQRRWPSADTAALVGSAPGLELGTNPLELGLVVGELGLAGVEVDGDEVEPLAVLGLRRRLQRRLAGRSDRPRRQTLVPVGVVGGPALALLCRRGRTLQ